MFEAGNPGFLRGDERALVDQSARFDIEPQTFDRFDAPRRARFDHQRSRPRERTLTPTIEGASDIALTRPCQLGPANEFSPDTSHRQILELRGHRPVDFNNGCGGAIFELADSQT